MLAARPLAQSRHMIVGVGYIPGSPSGGPSVSTTIGRDLAATAESIGFRPSAAGTMELRTGASRFRLGIHIGTARRAAEVASRSFNRAMASAALVFYVGHGRYGSGPDFDRPIIVRWQLQSGKWRVFEDLEDLEAFLSRYYPLRRPPDALADAVRNRRCVILSNLDGNVAFGSPSHTFGGRLYELAIESALGGPLVPPKERRDAGSRTLVFYACNSSHYVKPLRSSGTVNDDDIVLATKRDIQLGAEAAVFGNALHHVISGTTGTELRRSINRAARELEPGWTSAPFALM